MSFNVTEPEFLILRILWREGALSVREIHDQLSNQNGWAYTTTKTVMDRMAKKDVLSRESSHGVFLYRPLISKSQGMLRWVKFIANGLFETDYNEVVTMFSKRGLLSDSEIDELYNLLENEEDK